MMVLNVLRRNTLSAPGIIASNIYSSTLFGGRPATMIRTSHGYPGYPLEFSSRASPGDGEEARCGSGTDLAA